MRVANLITGELYHIIIEKLNVFSIIQLSIGGNRVSVSIGLMGGNNSIVFKTNLFTNKTLKRVGAILEARDASQVSYQYFVVEKNSELPMKAKKFNFFSFNPFFSNFSQNT